MSLRTTALLLALATPSLALADDPPPAEQAATSTPSDDDADAADAVEDGFGVGALPALNYNSDEGFGYGVIGTMYWYRGGVEPYRTALTLRFFMTTRNVHAHLLRVDAIDAFDLPLRLEVRAGYNSYLTQNYCGIASQSDCDLSRAEAAAADEGLVDDPTVSDDAYDDFVRRYYYYRYTEPFLIGNARWKLSDMPDRIEVFGGFRFSYYIPGTPGDPTPWPGSYYQTYVDPDGEKGLASVLQLGLMGDNRDNEPAPNSGYWVEASARAATSLSGDTWSYAGVNMTLRYYQTLIRTQPRDDDGPKVRRPNLLVSATRVVGDGVFGDAPTAELPRFGGSFPYSGIGGQYGGRGLRSWRYHGRAKFLAQEDLRFTPVTFTPGSQQFDLGLVGFADYGYGADAWSDLSVGNGGLGFGGGLRVTWNRNFIIRVDIAYSEAEDYAQKMYINLDHVF